jgi:hypothetical protein
MSPSKRYFAVGTALYRDVTPEARLVAESIAWLIKERNKDGTWGGPDQLDRFITTTHVAMALLAVGFSPDSEALSSAIKYLVNLDKEQNVSFFYRAGPLLNLPSHSTLVREDMKYLGEFRRRVGVHKDYPPPFFLLKIIRFADPKLELPFNQQDVVKWILEEWTDKDCWYGRTSITSMALALIYDLRFKDKQKIISRAKQCLLDAFTDVGNDTGYFSTNLVDDCFTVYNLCEGEFLERPENKVLKEPVRKTINHIIGLRKDSFWESLPPYGGTVGSRMYPTAVAIRAIISYVIRNDAHFPVKISSLLLDQQIVNLDELRRELTVINSFWGKISERPETNTCFTLMPFDPPKLTDIYRRYIKTPIESKTKLKCIRADDIYRSSEIMRDIWTKINEAKLIIAELTDKNPNVFYELGMAHTLGKNVILIAQSMDFIPFDLRGVRTIIYDDSPTGFDELSAQLLRFVEELRLT